MARVTVETTKEIDPVRLATESGGELVLGGPGFADRSNSGRNSLPKLIMSDKLTQTELEGLVNAHNASTIDPEIAELRQYRDKATALTATEVGRAVKLLLGGKRP